ncbi:MAG: hypothetical protein OEL89_01170 [Candidatus Peregrinibacteria bacterium]|nr:hypothetical protein [Candidatus Peregrinibacteria bacterium]
MNEVHAAAKIIADGSIRLLLVPGASGCVIRVPGFERCGRPVVITCNCAGIKLCLECASCCLGLFEKNICKCPEGDPRSSLALSLIKNAFFPSSSSPPSSPPPPSRRLSPPPAPYKNKSKNFTLVQKRRKKRKELFTRYTVMDSGDRVRFLTSLKKDKDPELIQMIKSWHQNQ